MPFLHTWSVAGPDSEEHNEKARCHPFSLQRGTDKKVHTLKVRGNVATDAAGAAELSTSPNRSGSVLVFPAGAHRSLREQEIHFCCCSLCSLLPTLGKPASEHPKQATGWWQTHRFREDLLDWNCKLPCNERDRAHGTPLAAAPRLWHHLSWRKYEINIFILFFRESFHPEANRVWAVHFILSSLSPTHFLPYCKAIWTPCDLCFRRVSSPKLLHRLSAESQQTDGCEWQQRCKELSKLFPSQDRSCSLHYVASKRFPSARMNICVSFTEHEPNLSEPKFPTSRRLVIFGVIIRPWAKTSGKSYPL